MKRLKIKFTTDRKKEAEYICFTAKSISLNHFPKGGFYVLPYSEILNTKTVYFPDLNYSKEFWKLIKNCKTKDLGEKFPDICVSEVLSKLPEDKDINKSEKIISEWKHKEKNFFEIVDDLFIGLLAKTRTIEILLTPYGTLGSYFVKDGRIIGTHRIDIPTDDIGRKILYSLIKFSTRKNTEIGEKVWHDRNAVVSFLMTNTKLKDLLSQVYDSASNKKEIKLKRDSEKYLHKLGFSNGNLVIRKTQWGKIMIKDKNAEEVFTKKEFLVVKMLLKNKGEICGFSEFPEFPSLEALAKTVENIRVKSRNLGINEEVITTVRGKGYSIS